MLAEFERRGDLIALCSSLEMKYYITIRKYMNYLPLGVFNKVLESSWACKDNNFKELKEELESLGLEVVFYDDIDIVWNSKMSKCKWVNNNGKKICLYKNS